MPDDSLENLSQYAMYWLQNKYYKHISPHFHIVEQITALTVTGVPVFIYSDSPVTALVVMWLVSRQYK